MPPGAANLVGHVLNARDQLLPLIVTCSTAENDGKTTGAAEVILAPLAVGDYQLSFSFDVNGETQSTVYAFRLIP